MYAAIVLLFFNIMPRNLVFLPKRVMGGEDL